MTSDTSDTGLRGPAKAREAVIRSLFGLCQAVKIHQANNQVVQRAARTLTRDLARLFQSAGDVTIQVDSRRIYVQEKRLAFRPETACLFDGMIDYLDRRSIGGLRFQAPVVNVPPGELVTFANILNRSEGHDPPLAWISERLASKGVSWVEVTPPLAGESESSAADPASRKKKGLKSYAHVLGSVQEIAGKLSSDQPAGLSRTRRVVQGMVDLIMEDAPLFHALSTIRFYDDYTYGHSVNVAILAMCIGKRIVLSKRSLESLGLCGLLHDLGKIEIPKSILNKPGKLTDEEFDVMKRHSINSVRLIVKIQASRNQKADILLAPFEHHLKYDLSGYPRTDRKESLSLFGRILAIADVYDAITSPRIYRPTVIPPDRALGLMWNGSGKDFDPILLKVFINMIGFYPIGTLLVLDNRKVGLVCETPEGGSEAEPVRPWVILVERDGKEGYKGGRRVNLSETDPKTGDYRRRIVKSQNAVDLGIQPMDILFS